MSLCVRGDQSPSDLAVSLAMWPMEDDTFIFALCQDHKLRVWSYKVFNDIEFLVLNLTHTDIMGYLIDGH